MHGTACIYMLNTTPCFSHWLPSVDEWSAAGPVDTPAGRPDWMVHRRSASSEPSEWTSRPTDDQPQSDDSKLHDTSTVTQDTITVIRNTLRNCKPWSQSSEILENNQTLQTLANTEKMGLHNRVLSSTQICSHEVILNPFTVNPETTWVQKPSHSSVLCTPSYPGIFQNFISPVRGLKPKFTYVCKIIMYEATILQPDVFVSPKKFAEIHHP